MCSSDLNVKPKKSISNKRVYEDRYLLRYFKYASVLERPATIAYQTTKMMATQTTPTKAYLKYLKMVS